MSFGNISIDSDVLKSSLINRNFNHESLVACSKQIIPFTKTYIRVHIYTGGDGDPTCNANIFMKAFIDLIIEIQNMVKLEIKYEVKNVEAVRKDITMTPDKFINWLLSSDIHFVVAHIHQGLIFPRNWDVEELYKYWNLLFYHRGFPNGTHLECPIFKQDKEQYLSAVISITNPTLKIQLLTNKNYKHLRPEILTFIQNNQESCMRWIVKGPYTTHGNDRWIMRTSKIFKSLEYAVDEIICILENKTITGISDVDLHGILPYVMLQPHMDNVKEKKVVVLNGKAAYIAQSSHTGKQFTKSNEEVMIFAENAVQHLKEACPSAIIDYLVRVDIFQNKDGELKVNEFESVEANYNGADNKKNCVASNFLYKYWCTVIRSIFKKFDT